MLTEEYGLQKVSPKPWKSAFATFCAFLFVGTMPLVPFLVPDANMQWQFAFSTVIAAFMFFSIGMLKSLVFSLPMLASGVRTLLTGGTAAARKTAVTTTGRLNALTPRKPQGVTASILPKAGPWAITTLISRC